MDIAMQRRIKINVIYTMKHEPSSVFSIFLVLVKEVAYKNGLLTSSRHSSYSYTLDSNTPFNQGWIPKVVGKVRLVRIQSAGVVNLLIADGHLNFRKNWLRKVLHMSNLNKWCFFRLFFCCSVFCFSFLRDFFKFLHIVSFPTTTIDKF